LIQESSEFVERAPVADTTVHIILKDEHNTALVNPVVWATDETTEKNQWQFSVEKSSTLRLYWKEGRVFQVQSTSERMLWCLCNVCLWSNATLLQVEKPMQVQSKWDTVPDDKVQLHFNLG